MYFARKIVRAVDEAEQKAREAEQKAREAEQKAQQDKEDMIIAAIQDDVQPSVINKMCQRAGITDARLAELMEQAKMG
jgi:hypothetical protein